jgi:hypothetical protein
MARIFVHHEEHEEHEGSEFETLHALHALHGGLLFGISDANQRLDEFGLQKINKGGSRNAKAGDNQSVI